MKRILLTLAALGTALTMQAKVVLPGIFGDNMVLQQQSEAQFWGKAAPAESVISGLPLVSAEITRPSKLMDRK